ncbi:glycosyl hydrolase 115 family protein [Leeuwenhoekiella sp. NPDC079379]|uniref:glycosyl hydrolase 115 family protein n=1 Tax=Leeuwenhoekiella sp. NPDC079379 TaxID=3364122 RepID=UPI0037C5F92A
MKSSPQIYLFFAIILTLGGITNSTAQTSFKLVDSKERTSLRIDKKEPKVVHIAAEMLNNDVFKITGKQLGTTTNNTSTAILAGTLGTSSFINDLVAAKKIDTTQLSGKWETYSIQLIENPTKDISQALVIVGSDRRATAYGLLELSRRIGVSPWEWWADVTPDKNAQLSLTITPQVYGEPSVKYRGIFLNDEDWGLQRWAALNFEPKTGDIGPKTYAKVFELLLRLRANTIWPAMHTCTKAFYHYPENKIVADDYAIVVGSSHAEPMLCNINAEWDHDKMGDYRYDTNAGEIKKLFKKRARETADYEGIYTLGMRGEHDSPMIVGDDDTPSQVKLLEQVITDQREILKETKQDLAQVPQAFVPYKEVLHYYQNGLKLPEDVTLVWTDDNYGYLRQLSNPEEQKRSGGAGIYYHTSYWGRPHDYLWLNSTHPVLMWEELSKAYSFKAEDIWILNAGDIKPHEYNTELFMDMAWDMSKFETSEAVAKHQFDWAAREFGTANATQIDAVLDTYYQLALQRRPEFMAWSAVEPVIKSGETQLTQIHYGDEVSKRIDAYQTLMDKVEALKPTISANRKDAFFELVYYPVMGAAQLNQMWLYAYKNKHVASQGRASAAVYAQKSGESYDAIERLTRYFNDTIQDGKWQHIMNKAPRNLPVFSKPVVSFVNSQEPGVGLALEGYEMEYNKETTNSFADVLPVFNAYTKNRYYIDVFLKGSEPQTWSATPAESWIELSTTSGKLSSENPEERVWVTINWSQVPKGTNKKEAPLGHDHQLIPPSYKVNSKIDFTTGTSETTVGVSVFNPQFEVLKDFNGFVEDKGFVVINAENPSAVQKGKEASWKIINRLGYSNSVMRAEPLTAASETILEALLKNAPVLEYDFYTFNFGTVDVKVSALPTHAVYPGKGVRCAVSIDGATPQIIDFQTEGRSESWKENVFKNRSVQSVSQIVNKPGKHSLKVYMVDPGVMLDQIVIDLGGLKDAYAFPEETKN